MASEITRNTFDGGINSDLSSPNTPPNQFVDSLNLSLIGEGKFTALQNIKGTTSIGNLTSGTNTEILGVFANKYKIGTVEGVNCLTVFKATTSGTIQILCHDLDNNIIYQLYSTSTPVDYITSDRVIDGVSYAEAGLDIIYFTDNYYGPRKLRCEIPSVYVPNFLNDSDLQLTKKAALGTISLASITTGGSLLTGSYQFAYQLINTSKNRYSKFSLLETPIHIYTTINGLVYAGVGLPSNKKILLNIDLAPNEATDYTHFRLAIVENVYPEGTDVAILSQIGLSSIELISSYLSGGDIVNYPIVSNVQTESTTIDEIVIDLAAIERVKTLEIRDNRLLLGNVTFKELTYDRGAPTNTSGGVIKMSGTGDSFSSDEFSSRYMGHFRGEVYRYAIAYFDGDGNFSSPTTIDTSGMTFNTISGSKDLKYPDRKDFIFGNYFTPLTASNNTESLGLRIDNINNHPTWAHGFVILRAKRKKNIKFQTPLIPLAPWYGIGSVGQYPTIYNEGPGPTAVTNDNAVPMGPSVNYLPYNLFYGGYTITGTSGLGSSGGAGNNTFLAGESRGMRYSDLYSTAAIYPPDYMYSTNGFSLAGNEQIRTIDAAICRLYFNRFDSEAYNCGLGLNTNCSGSFFASLNGDYYFNDGHGGVKPGIRDYISTTYTNTISGYKTFENLSNGTILNGKNIVDFTKLTTGNVTFGTNPTTQKFVAIDLGDSISATGGPTYPLTFASGVPVYSPTAGGNILDTSEFITSTTGLYGSYVNTIEIVNVLSGLSDNRYGDTDDFNEFIFTGAKVIFSSGELTTVAAGGSVPKTVNIWGGDCIVSPHTFKIADSGYAVTNQPKLRLVPAGESAATVIGKWGKSWFTDTGSNAPISMPAPFLGAAQYLTIILESEYHGSVRDVDTYDSVGTYTFPIRGISSLSKVKAPLTYNANINLNKQNDQKIFVPIDSTQPVAYNYKSRIYFTDNKIYQTNIEGFDTIRVLNYKDLQERFGGITKLQVSGDNFYALQESGVAYIPIGERILELSNSSQLGVQSGDILGDPVYINTIRGCQHLRSVRDTGDSFYFVDNRNKAIYHVNGQDLKDITEKGFLSTSRNLFQTAITERNIHTVYDPVRGEYWVANKDGSFCYVWNEKFGSWISNYTFPTQFSSGLFTNNKLYVVGKNGSNFETATMYTGNPGQLFGTYVTDTYVDFRINPSPDLSKTFDDILVTTSDRLESFDIVVERESSLGNQSNTGMNLDVTSRGEGTHRIKILRDSSGARMRGIFANAKINWRIGGGMPQVNLYSVNTVFRPSI